MMKAVLFAMAAVIFVAWAEVAARRLHAGTARTSNGNLRVVNVYHKDVNDSFTAEISGMEFGPRVVGGNFVRLIRRFPYIVALLVVDKEAQMTKLKCTGTLIDGDIAMTAANCLNDQLAETEAYAVCSGVVDLTKDTKLRNCAAVVTAVSAFGFDPEQPLLGYDMAMLKLADSILGEDAGVVHRIKVGFRKPKHLATAFIAGFGRNDVNAGADGRMYYSEANVVLNEGQCEILNQNYYGEVPLFICGKGVSGSGVCFGDSGSPLLVKKRKAKNHVQVGILSLLSSNCNTDSEAVYTSLYFRDNKVLFKALVKELGGTFLKGRV